MDALFHGCGIRDQEGLLRLGMNEYRSIGRRNSQARHVSDSMLAIVQRERIGAQIDRESECPFFETVKF
jgi:hypothetical protein